MKVRCSLDRNDMLSHRYLVQLVMRHDMAFAMQLVNPWPLALEISPEVEIASDSVLGWVTRCLTSLPVKFHRLVEDVLLCWPLLTL